MVETVEEYLERGGEIQSIKTGATALDPYTLMPASEKAKRVYSAKKGALKANGGRSKQVSDNRTKIQ